MKLQSCGVAEIGTPPASSAVLQPFTRLRDSEIYMIVFRDLPLAVRTVVASMLVGPAVVEAFFDDDF